MLDQAGRPDTRWPGISIRVAGNDMVRECWHPKKRRYHIARMTVSDNGFNNVSLSPTAVSANTPPVGTGANEQLRSDNS